MYQVKMVYFEKGSAHYYILNIATKQVQSVWETYIEALDSARRLNMVAA